MKKEESIGIKKNLLFIAIIIFLFLIIIFLIFIIFEKDIKFVFFTKTCNSKECFISSLNNCRTALWIKKDQKAEWLYVINGKSNAMCSVSVKLLKMFEGSIDLENLQEKEMTCTVPAESIDFPEKDLSLCSGKLKEEIQEMLIQKMHNYLLQNIGQLKQEFIGF